MAGNREFLRALITIDPISYVAGLIVGILLLVGANFTYAFTKDIIAFEESLKPTDSFVAGDYQELRSYVETLTTPTSTLSPTPQLAKLDEKPQGFCLKVPVLLYHHVKPLEEAKKAGHAQLTVDVDYFDSQMKYLVDNGYQTISADELADSLINKQTIPGKPILVTLDDGYLDTYTYAFQIAKKYNITLNVMISTGLLNNNGYMNWDQVKEMEKSGLVHNYNHTWSHFGLSYGSVERMRQEVATADRQLEEQLGKEQRIFTYPYGAFNDEAIKVLKEQGYVAAFTISHSYWQCDSILMTLHRNHIGNAPLSSYEL